MNFLVNRTKSSSFLNLTGIFVILLLSRTIIKADEPIATDIQFCDPTKNETLALDFSKENADFDAFWDSEFGKLERLDEIIKKIEENPAISDKLAELTLNCNLCRYTADDGTTKENLRFCQLPKDLQETTKKKCTAELLTALKRELIRQNLETLTTNHENSETPSQKKLSWYGLSLADIITRIPICYISGRQVRDAGVPGFDEIVSISGPFKIVGDIILGYCSNMFATICHEAGHSIAYRSLYGKWPEKVTIGSDDSNSPALISFRNGAIALRGLDPLAGAATLDSNINLKEARSIPVFAAGGISGITGYYFFKKMIHTILGKKFPNFEELGKQYERIENKLVSVDNSLHKLFGLKEDVTTESFRNRLAFNRQLQLMMLPLAVDTAIWFQLKNVILNHDVQGSDAYAIGIATGHLLDRALEKIVAKFRTFYPKKTSNKKVQ